jgi:hypothetical protein
MKTKPNTFLNGFQWVKVQNVIAHWSNGQKINHKFLQKHAFGNLTSVCLWTSGFQPFFYVSRHFFGTFISVKNLWSLWKSIPRKGPADHRLRNTALKRLKRSLCSGSIDSYIYIFFLYFFGGRILAQMQS